jgi:hypothetical protein
MNNKTTLSKLSNADLESGLAWQVTGEQDAENEDILVRAPLIDGEVLPASVREVWCLCWCTFKDGSKHFACAMCRGDTTEGPLAITVWNGSSNIRLMVPPAPTFVLAKEGPEVFARKFSLPVDAVFPLRVEVAPRFSKAPHTRAVVIDTSGVVLHNE